MYLRLPLWIRHKAELLRRADEENLDIAGWYSTPAHPCTGQILQDLGYEPAACPRTEEAFHSVVTLPTWPALRPAQLERAVQLLRDAQ